jgi:PQQ-dependent catabolism-associated beta-propeller protein
MIPLLLTLESIFVSDEAGRCVQQIDGASLKVVRCIDVGQRPRGLVPSPDGKRLYVAVSDENRIAVIDVPSGKVTRTIASGPDPETFAISKDERTLYVGNEEDNQVSIIDAASGSIKPVMVGGEPEGTALSPDEKLLVQASESGGMAHVIDTASGKVLANLMVDTRPRHVTFTPDGKQFWVSSEVRGTVSVFDTATLKPAGKIDFEAANLTSEPVQPVGVRFTRDGKRAFVALGRGKLVAEVDPVRLTVRLTWPVGLRAWNLALSPDERRIYTADGLDGTMSVVDLTSGKTATVKLGGKPWGVEAVP